VLPTLEGVIRRRVLLNFRADPGVVASLLPSPLEVLSHEGFAIVGVCLIGMEQLRPKGLPSVLGLSSENMAHRIAIRYLRLLGGRLFPGVQHRADFTINDAGDCLSMDVKTEDGQADVSFEASHTTEWAPDSVFATFDDAFKFFRRGDCGFSCSLRAGRLDGLQLKTLRWEMSTLRVSRLCSAFFQHGERFSSDLVHFDCALLMRGVPHEWHEISEIPELAGLIGE
jgi:hypothetical protein